ncbi:MAG TPA: hypothetical protein VN213_20240 [Solirubrobacteraceae bacterium]|nr:hypothetical protein [Solirubrobacteraceae bacterium]
MKTDTVDGALAPALTKWDLCVLAATPLEPEPWTIEALRATWLSTWRIAEALREEDVKYVRQTLRGLEDRGLVRSSPHWELHRKRWLRTREGDRYLEKAQP